MRPFFEDNAWEAVWSVSKPTIAMVMDSHSEDGTGVIRDIDSLKRSTFGQPRSAWTHYGRTQRLCRLVGYGGLEIVLSGGMVGAGDALSMGIVNRLCKR